MKVTQPNNERYHYDKYVKELIGNGLTRSFNGSAPGLITETKPGEILIPTHSIDLPESEWSKIAENTGLHNSLLNKLGLAILENTRRVEETRVEGFPTLRDLGFNDKEIEVLLLRPEIQELFIISRTDLLLTDDGYKKVETNTSQPGGSEVVDLLSDLFTNTLGIGRFEGRIMPQYCSAIESFWKKYNPEKSVDGIVILSGGYSLGTKYLVEELKSTFPNSSITVEGSETQSVANPTKEERDSSAKFYADQIGEKFFYDKEACKLYYITNEDSKKLVSIILHEPRIDLQHFVALLNTPIMEAYKDGAIEIVNPPKARVVGTKKVEFMINDSRIHAKMSILGFTPTEAEIAAEKCISIASDVVTGEKLTIWESNPYFPWQSLIIKDDGAGSGNGIFIGKKFDSKSEFLSAVRASMGRGTQFIIMTYENPCVTEIDLITKGQPRRIKTVMDLNPYSITSVNRHGLPGFSIPACPVSRALVGTEVQLEMAQKDGIKLNVLGPDNRFRDGTEYAVSIGVPNIH